MKYDTEYLRLVKTYIASVSDRMVDPVMKQEVAALSDPPKAVDVLDILDKAVHGSLCSDFEIRLLDGLLNSLIELEGTTFEAVASQAPFRRFVGG